MHPTKLFFQLLAYDYEGNYNAILSTYKMSKSDVAKMVMEGRESEIPIPVLRAMYQHDTCARILNVENYCPDRESWRLKHYVDDLVEGLYAWVGENEKFLQTARELDATKDVPSYTESEIYQTIALVAMKNVELKDERSQVEGASS